jgi:hypothetical protein
MATMLIVCVTIAARSRDAADSEPASPAGTHTSAASLTTRSAKPGPIDTPVSIDARSAPVADGLLIAVDALQLQFTVPLTLSDLTLARIAPLPAGFAVGFSTRTLEAMEPDCGAGIQPWAGSGWVVIQLIQTSSLRTCRKEMSTTFGRRGPARAIAQRRPRGSADDRVSRRT